MHGSSDSELTNMLAGDLYLASDPQLVAMRLNARRLTRLYNATREDESAERRRLLIELFERIGDNIEIEPPFRCDYGSNITLGDRVYMNFGCVILDCAKVTIGERSLLGPNVHLYAATHPTDPRVRESGRELAKPISIGRNVWIGGGSIVCPGVTIGDDAVIGAGSVVTRDVAPSVIAAGNPCRVPEKRPIGTGPQSRS